MASLALFFVFACVHLPNVEASPLFDRQQAADDPSSGATYLRRAPLANEMLRQRYKLKRNVKPRIQTVTNESIQIDEETVSLEDADLESVDRDLFAPNARCVMNGRVQAQLPQPAVYRSRADVSVTITKDHEGNVLSVTKRAADNSGKTTDLFHVDSDTWVAITSDEIDQVALNQEFQYAHVEVPPEHSSRHLWDTQASNQTTTMLAGNNYQHQHRFLAACSSFDVIQVAIAFESTFCAAFGKNQQRAQDAVLMIVYEANKFYEVPGLCKRLVISRLEGYCKPTRDPYRSMITMAKNVCGDGTDSNLLDRFRTFWNKNRSSVNRDMAHLFHGKSFSTPIIGCSYLSTLCRADYAYGVNFITFTPLTSYWPILFSHEAGHNAGANHDCDSK